MYEAVRRNKHNLVEFSHAPHRKSRCALNYYKRKPILPFLSHNFRIYILEMVARGVLTSVSMAIMAVATAAAPLVSLEKREESNNGLTDRVTWDKHSLLIDGERLFFFSGEFHVWIHTLHRIVISSCWLIMMCDF